MKSQCTSKHPYAGRTAVLATKHGKERQIAPFLRVALDLQVSVPPDLDTDLLGTFSGELPRQGSPIQVALQKARMGMWASGLTLGLANEGSFGPHPAFPMLIADTEILVFVDDERGIQVQEVLVSEQAIAAQCTTRSLDEIAPFLERVLFPSHGLIVRPLAALATLSPDQIIKGITDTATLARAIEQSAALSPDKLAHIETDLRANMNPTRRRIIRRVAACLARRLARLCPQCATPGWGQVDVVCGLPCEWCGGATALVREEISGCPSCSYREYTPRSDHKRTAPAAQCPFCNP